MSGNDEITSGQRYGGIHTLSTQGGDEKLGLEDEYGVKERDEGDVRIMSAGEEATAKK